MSKREAGGKRESSSRKATTTTKTHGDAARSTSSSHSSRHRSALDDSSSDDDDDFPPSRSANDRSRGNGAATRPASSAASTRPSSAIRQASAASKDAESTSSASSRPTLNLAASSSARSNGLSSPKSSSLRSPTASIASSSSSSRFTVPASPSASTAALPSFSSSTVVPPPASQTQMRSLLSFLDEHEQATEKEAQKLALSAVQSLSSPRSSSSLSSPRAASRVGVGSSNFEQAFAATTQPYKSASAASTLVAGPTYKAHANAPRSSASSVVSITSSSSSLASTTVAPVPAASSSSGGVSFSDIKSKMMSLKSTVAEKEAQIAALERQLQDAKTHSAAQLSSQSSTFNLQLSQQKSDYESTLLRHQTFIETLLANKAELQAKMATLSEEIVNLERGFEEKLEKVMREQEMEFKKRQEIFMQAEKVKRDQFVAQKTKSIKALTIKGLEPELERIMSQSKRDLAAAEESFTKEMERKMEEQAREGERMMQQLRTAMIDEREAALEKERQHAQQRVQEQMDRSDQLLLEQRTRFHEELERQKHMIDSSRSKNDESSFESRIASLKEQHSKDLLLERHRFDSALSLQQTQHETERTRWQTSVSENIGARMRERETELRRRLENEQKEELELLLQKVSAESTKAAEESALEHKRVVARLQAQIKSLQEEREQGDRGSKGELERLRTEAASLSSSLSLEQRRSASLSSSLRERDASLSLAQSKLDAFESNSASLRSEVEQGFQHRITSLERECVALKESVRNERDRALDERRIAEKALNERVAHLERRHAGELDSLQLRVKHMVEKKELVISQMRAELDAKDRKMREIESVME